jgi:hypothetical protein
VHNLLHPPNQPPLRYFSPHSDLKAYGRLCSQPLASERDLEDYEFVVESQVRDVIIVLRSIPAATALYRLGDGIQFENHANTISRLKAHRGSGISSPRLTLHTIDTDSNRPNTEEAAARKWTIPDQFCVRRVDGKTGILYSVENKPPHKLTTDYLRDGPREMNFWEGVVQRTTIPTDEGEKSKYDADLVTGAAIAQVFSGMIEDGIAYATLTNGQATVFFRVAEDDLKLSTML